MWRGLDEPYGDDSGRSPSSGGYEVGHKDQVSGQRERAQQWGPFREEKRQDQRGWQKGKVRWKRRKEGARGGKREGILKRKLVLPREGRPGGSDEGVEGFFFRTVPGGNDSRCIPAATTIKVSPMQKGTRRAFRKVVLKPCASS